MATIISRRQAYQRMSDRGIGSAEVARPILEGEAIEARPDDRPYTRA